MFDLAAKGPAVAKAIATRLSPNGKLAGAAE
jgi:hypothetical protein